MLLIASAFACNILDAAASNGIDYKSLFSATGRGDVESVQNFLRENRDVDINYQDAAGHTPLHIASSCGHMELASLFLDSGADIERRSFGYNLTPLMVSFMNKKTEMTRFLLVKGADVNAEDISRRDALYFAAENGDEQLVRLLLESGAKTDKKPILFYTAAEIAQQNGHHEIALLITSWNPNDGTEIKEPEGN